MNEDAEEQLLNVEQTAAFLNISRTTLWKLCGTETTPQVISFYQVGKRRVFSRQKHIEPFLSAHERLIKEQG